MGENGREIEEKFSLLEKRKYNVLEIETFPMMQSKSLFTLFSLILTECVHVYLCCLRKGKGDSQIQTRPDQRDMGTDMGNGDTHSRILHLK